MSEELCEFYRAAPGLLRCRFCPNRLRTEVDPALCRARCRRNDPPRSPALNSSVERANLEAATECRRRGEPLREERNELCGCANRREVVYACAIHGECALRRFRHGQRVAVCLGCERREAGPSSV